MNSATHSVRRARGVALRAEIARAVAAVALGAPVVAACGGSAPATAVMVEDRALVGMWMGPMRGTYGRTVLTLRVQADSTISTDTENPRYTRLEGTWTVSGSQFMATVDDGGGVLVTLLASAPFVHLTGSWNANNGSSGTFDLAKR